MKIILLVVIYSCGKGFAWDGGGGRIGLADLGGSRSELYFKTVLTNEQGN